MSEEWEILKEKGNEEFRKKNYNTAISLYTDAIGKINYNIDINPDEETLFGNRSNCYKLTGKLKLAKYDLNKALQIKPKNTKNLKRLANIHILTGNLGEAEILIQKCINFEPKDPSHTADLTKVQTLLKNYERVKEYHEKQDYTSSEELAAKMLQDCAEWSEIKQMYIESLLHNVKLPEATKFLVSKLTPEESNKDEFQYLLCLTFYYDGQYEKARKLLHNLLSKCNDNSKFNQLFKILREIEKLKDKGKFNFNRFS
jgi:tetratricopeptide (TPR) repeat protein